MERVVVILMFFSSDFLGIMVFFFVEIYNFFKFVGSWIGFLSCCF